jgi:hypothetical protein
MIRYSTPKRRRAFVNSGVLGYRAAFAEGFSTALPVVMVHSGQEWLAILQTVSIGCQVAVSFEVNSAVAREQAFA